MGLYNWSKVLWTIKHLNKLNKKSYFDLEKFCIENNLNYKKIKYFLEVSNDIINGDSDLIRAFEQEKEELEILNNLNPKLLETL